MKKMLFASFLFASCVSDSATKIDYDICLTGQVPCFDSSIEAELRINADMNFVYKHRCLPSSELWDTLENGEIVALVTAPVDPIKGEWQPLENGEILLRAEGEELFDMAYDSATAKGVRRIDARRYVLNIAADSVSLGKGVWLQRHACSIRLRRK